MISRTKRRMESTLRDEAMHLPNMNQLELDVQHLKQAPEVPVHFICYDIISLRKLNCTYGRGAVDTLLRRVADWVIGESRGKLYRIEGDMFCVLMQGRSFEEAMRFAHDALRRSKKAWRLGSGANAEEAFATVHLAVIPADDYVWQQNLLDLFERMLDQARETRGVAVFNREADEVLRGYIQMQMDIKNDVLDHMKGFSVSYQPIVDPLTGIWRGLEALCRWHRHGSEESVPPYIFIPEVEKMGLMSELGYWVLETALREVLHLGLHRQEEFFISVNVSPSQLLQPDFGQQVKRLLKQHHFPADKLNLEITESTEFLFSPTTHAIINELRQQGVSFALDDFGTGYSTFSHLKNLPAQYIKLEREFVWGIELDTYLQYSLYVITETAHANGMRLVAEGIETKEQLRCSVKNGVDLIQGYYYCRPIPSNQLDRHLDNFVRPGHNALDQEAGDAFNLATWFRSQEAYNITPSLFQLLNQCMGLLLSHDDIDIALNEVLAAVGAHFQVSRAFVFLREEGTVFSNRYEWCSPGTPAQKHLLQRIDGDVGGFYEALNEQQVMVISSEGQLPGDLAHRLAEGGLAQSIQSMLVLPIKRREEVIGFVGFDDERSREWMPEEVLLLHMLCMLVLIKLNMWGAKE